MVKGLDPPPLGVEGQSVAQWPSCLHLGHGPGGWRGVGQARAQCPSRPHQKHGLGGVRDFPWPRELEIGGFCQRACANIWNLALSLLSLSALCCSSQ
jgi:hypothetical protein